MKMLDEEEISLENRQKTTQNRNFNNIARILLPLQVGDELRKNKKRTLVQ